MLPGFGVSPSPHILLPPRLGAKGFDSSIQALLAGSPSLPAPTLDSRLRGNDPPEADRGLGGFLGACNAPLQRFAVMVQRNAAGSLRVSLRYFLQSPQEWGLEIWPKSALGYLREVYLGKRKRRRSEYAGSTLRPIRLVRG